MFKTYNFVRGESDHKNDIDWLREHTERSSDSWELQPVMMDDGAVATRERESPVELV